MLFKKFIIKFNKQMQKNQKPIKPQDFYKWKRDSMSAEF